MPDLFVQCRTDGLSLAGEVTDAGQLALLAELFGADVVADALDGTAAPDGTTDVPQADGSGFGQREFNEMLRVFPDDHDVAERVIFEAEPPAWFGLPPGPQLSAALDRVDVDAASPTALIELMVAAQRLQSWAEALRVCAMAAFYRRRAEEAAVADRAPGRVIDEPREVGELSGRPVRDPLRSAAAEIAAALRLAPTTVTDHVAVARQLCDVLPETVRELRMGRITFSKALTIAQSTALLDADAQRAVQDRVLPKAPDQTGGQLRAACRRAVATVDARSAEERHERATRERTARKVPLPDGMAGIWFTHTADRIEACWVVIQALADLATDRAAGAGRTGAGITGEGDPSRGSAANGQSDSDVDAAGDQGVRDERTADQRRADAVADCLTAVLENGVDWLGRALPNQHRRRPHIEILVPFGTLLGLDEEPAELAGYGPVPASVARRLAADGRWRRILTDPATGVALEAATRRHDPPAQVSETLIVRDQTCRWPGCRQPARRSHRDHVPKHRPHGITQLMLMAMFCVHHHDLKDFGDWTVTAEPGGVLRFVAPTGHVYYTEPPRLYPESVTGQGTTAAPSDTSRPTSADVGGHHATYRESMHRDRTVTADGTDGAEWSISGSRAAPAGPDVAADPRAQPDDEDPPPF
jgi:Domain of unknown function (DUF222)